MRINYSSAKAILSQHRKSNIIAKRKPKSKLRGLEAEFREIDENEIHKPQSILICSVGGRISSEKNIYLKTKLIKKVNLVVQIQHSVLAS